jgi:hypothetical protein
LIFVKNYIIIYIEKTKGEFFMITINRYTKEILSERRTLVVDEFLCAEVKDLLIRNLENLEDAEKLSVLTPRYMAELYFDKAEDITISLNKECWFGFYSKSLGNAVRDILDEYLWECEPKCYESETESYEDHLEMTEEGEQLMMDFMYQ